jgi:hypothetical protein
MARLVAVRRMVLRAYQLPLLGQAPLALTVKSAVVPQVRLYVPFEAFVILNVLPPVEVASIV